jgi:hypothetical protein
MQQVARNLPGKDFIFLGFAHVPRSKLQGDASAFSGIAFTFHAQFQFYYLNP